MTPKEMTSSSPGLNVGVVGATGMVGKTFIELLEERNFPIASLRPFASTASEGKTIRLQGKYYAVVTLPENDAPCFEGLDVVFFSSGDDISLIWAPRAVKQGAYAIDNSAAFRMDTQIKLVVPEVNGDQLKKNNPVLIANPNCSTIQLVVALKPLLDNFGIESVTVSSYQAVSGAGQVGPDELLEQIQFYQKQGLSQGITRKTIAPNPKTFARPIAFNCVPQIGSINEQGFSTEELKIMNETIKILDAPKLKVSAFTVRVPVLNAHSETVWVTLEKVVTRTEIIAALKAQVGLVVLEGQNEFPTPSEISGHDPVYVGRVHQDLGNPKTWLLWVVSDNLKKGAALNGIQIAEKIFS